MDFGSEFVYSYSDSEEEEISAEAIETTVDSAPEVATQMPPTPARDAMLQSEPARVTTSRSSSGIVGGMFSLISGLLSSVSGPIPPVSGPIPPVSGPIPPVSGPIPPDRWPIPPVSGPIPPVRQPIPVGLIPPAPTRPTSGIEAVGSQGSRGSLGSRSAATGEKWRRADTNVVILKFDRLTDPSNMHTGDSIVCIGCQAMLSHISKINQNGKKMIWTCEFCETKNEVEIVPEEIPTQSDVTYMLEPALVAAAVDGGASGGTENQESIVVFCIDYSGSMSSVVARNGPNSITRLDGVKRAVCHQLDRLADSSPGCRVAVVAFNHSVDVIGDGKDMPQHRVPSDIFRDKMSLLDVASNLSLPSKISDSRKTLTQNVLRERSNGSTALGPGLLVSLGIARQMARSKVIVCTDGQANHGLGSLGIPDVAYSFYSEAAEIAKESGVSVSVLTISGTDCRLVELGRVAEVTGGQVNIVDPLTATEEFGNILADTFIATHATARFSVHRDLYVRGEPDRPSHVLRDIGNVIRGAEISFEYGVRPKKKPKKDDGCKGTKKDDRGDDKRDEPDDDSVAVLAHTTTTTAAASDDNRSQKHCERSAQPATAPVDQDTANTREVQKPVDIPTTQESTDVQEPVCIPVVQEPANQAMDQEPAIVPIVQEPANLPVVQEPANVLVTEKPSSPARDEPLTSEKSALLPFQVQIRYTDSTGAKAVRVFTETKPVTKDRKVAESRMNIPIIGTHAIQYAADWAIKGQYMESRLTDCAYTNLFQRNAATSEHYKQGWDKYEMASKHVKGSVMYAQRAEARSHNSTVMDAEKMLQRMGPDEVRKKRRQMASDKSAEGYYMGKKFTSVQFARTADKQQLNPPVLTPPSASLGCEASSSAEPKPTDAMPPPAEVQDQS